MFWIKTYMTRIWHRLATAIVMGASGNLLALWYYYQDDIMYMYFGIFVSGKT